MPLESSLLSSRRPVAYKPKLELRPGDLQVLPVYLTGEVPALSRRTFVSQHITWSFTIIQAQIHFPAGCDHLVRAYLYISPDNDAPTTQEPTGINLLASYAPTPWIVADNITLSFQLNMTHRPKGAWLKLHSYNLDSFSHFPAALLTILEFPEED